MLTSLLAVSGMVIDIIFFVLLVGGIALGVQSGFIKSICKLAGTVFSLIFAFAFCVSFADALEGAFGMTSAIASGLTNAFSGSETLSLSIGLDVAGSKIETALTDAGITGFYGWLIALSFRNVEVVHAGTTGAMLLGSLLANWISILIAFVALFLIMKFGSILIAHLLNSLANSMKLFRILNQILGGIVGFMEAMACILILLGIMSWLPIPALHEFLSSTTVVGAIYNSEWFMNATNYAVSGQWFSDYISEFLPQ